eukprot:748933-Hanusia_phi.AAC.6
MLAAAAPAAGFTSSSRSSGGGKSLSRSLTTEPWSGEGSRARLPLCRKRLRGVMLGRGGDGDSSSQSLRIVSLILPRRYSVSGIPSSSQACWSLGAASLACMSFTAVFIALRDWCCFPGVVSESGNVSP